MTWVQVWDDSFNPVPISRLPEMYAAGYRVWGRYGGSNGYGGSSAKWWTKAQIAAWFACGPDTGVVGLFEGDGTEPKSHPELGDNHALAARVFYRAMGWPDSIPLVPAMDTDIGVADWTGNVADYCKRWKASDRAPVLYVEADAGAYLSALGVICGTFTPAAYGWNKPAVLYTPANAPGHVVWTQEHNGRKQAGGVIDAGHIRTDAPCVWWNPAGSQGSVPIAGEDMPLTTDDVHTILTAKSLPADSPTMSLGTVVMDAQAKARAAAAGVDALTAKVDALAAKVDALPTTAAPAAPMSDADKDDIAKRVADLLAGRLES